MLDALVQHHVRLRHDADAPPVLIHHQVVAQVFLAKAHRQVVQQGRVRHRTHRRAHRLAHREREGGGVVEIHRERVALGPDAQYRVALDHQDGADAALAHAPRGLVQRHIGRAFEQVAADDFTDAYLLRVRKRERLIDEQMDGFGTIHERTAKAEERVR